MVDLSSAAKFEYVARWWYGPAYWALILALALGLLRDRDVAFRWLLSRACWVREIRAPQVDWQAALRARLINDSPVTALVGTKITWVSRPQTTSLPAITLQTVSEERPQHMKGLMGYNPALVQIDAWATSHKDASTALDAAIDALVPANTANSIRFDRAFVQRKGDLPPDDEPNSTVFRASADLMFHYSTA